MFIRASSTIQYTFDVRQATLARHKTLPRSALHLSLYASPSSCSSCPVPTLRVSSLRDPACTMLACSPYRWKHSVPLETGRLLRPPSPAPASYRLTPAPTVEHIQPISTSTLLHCTSLVNGSSSELREPAPIFSGVVTSLRDFHPCSQKRAAAHPRFKSKTNTNRKQLTKICRRRYCEQFQVYRARRRQPE